MVKGATLEIEGSLVRFPVKYTFILNFSLAYRYSQLGEAHTMKSSITFVQSNGRNEIYI